MIELYLFLIRPHLKAEGFFNIAKLGSLALKQILQGRLDLLLIKPTLRPNFNLETIFSLLIKNLK